MKQFAFALTVLVAASAWAQEIGTEITPTTPSSGVQNQPQNQNQAQTPPPAEQPPQKQGYVYKPKGAKDEASAATPAFAGNKVSASSGDFGIRAGFGASGSVGLPTGTGGNASVAAPTVGIAYFGGDSFKLLVDLGFGLGLVGSNALFALSATLGFDYMFRTPGDVLRPFFHAGASFSMAGSSNMVIGFGAQLGFGAEYFFNPAFSVNGRLLLAVPMAIPGDFVLGIFTVTPGVGATWYL